MVEPGSDRRVREKKSWHRATVLELFFDLVFVFALNRISFRLLEDFHSGGLGFKGFAETLLLFLGLWFMWQTTAALASRVHPDSLPGQFIVFSSMAGATVMAVAVPQGFEQRALVFAGAWVAVRVSRLLLYLLARQVRTGGSPLPGLLSLAGSSVPWIAGALVNDPLLRGGFWAVALAIEFPGFVVGFRQWAGGQVAGEHLAERLQQIFLISLGEAVFVSGRAFSDSDLALPHAMGFALAFVGIVQLWRIYFYRAGLVLPAAITAARDPTRQSVAAAMAHLIMISGVVLAGVGFELYIFEPAGRPEPNWLVAILGGPALFLLGRAPFELQVFGRISRSRLFGLLALGVLIPAAWETPPLVAGAGSTAVLVAVAVADAVRARSRGLEPPATLL
ncbi:low temperature requirement protein A [Micromonospora sp. PPF5-17]|uniref:Low temperature requirement protein A n=1 Tax=Micromonospora solifontis TaxID=2487138 RepID=A0ABX9WFM5_9ACTN|nr:MULTISPECIES: low temperature requirement protein A [Micromonospora]NES37553.1 low temperature requirement protein A [Micromonospora solifontis]NES58225.1 low temperature requirement protein A [Micromonospora sp. PPF5-6]RNL98266.1 low temperature requirement protein A [Micromonospora solifontis]